MSKVYLGRERGARAWPLGDVLGEGASGKVHSIPTIPGSAAKLYHTEEECRRYEAKVDLMLTNRPDLPPLMHKGTEYPQIAWPEAKLYDKTGRFIGFAMPEIDFGRSTSLVNLLQKSSRRAEGISEYYGYRLLVARNLASVFAELHRAGHHMIDMKPANLRFYPEVSWMAVVDSDGFSIAGDGRRIAAEQLSDEYIAPESWKKQPAELGMEQDLFALAVIIFQLLNNGLHPFAGGSTGRAEVTDLQGRIVAGYYPYGLRPRAGLTPSAASLHEGFPQDTRFLFDRAFVPGALRPSAVEWRDHLDLMLQRLVPCLAKPVGHAHFGVGCGFCAQEARMLAIVRARPRPEVERPRVAARPRRPAAKPGAPAFARSVAGASPPPRPPMPVSRVALAAPLPRRAAGGRWYRWRGWPVLVLAGIVALGNGDAGQRLLGWGSAATATDWEAPAASQDVLVQLRRYLATPAEAMPVEIERAATLPVEAASHGPAGVLSIHGTRRTSPGARNGPTPCSEPTTWLDRRICAEPELAENERALMRRYRQLLVRSDEYSRLYLADGQEAWAQSRDSCQTAPNPTRCLTRVDHQRRADLDNWPDGNRRTVSASNMY
jgi:hypothetical protein